MEPFVNWRNRYVHINQEILLSNQLEDTYLSADLAAASGTLTVKNINGFSTSQFLWINPFSETSEIVTTHSMTAPSGSTITLSANTVFQHFAGEKVYRIEFNQVEISHASTLTGSKSVLSTESIQADQQVLKYLDTTQTSGFYFARFKNSVASTFGSYSDGVQYGTWDRSTVGYIIDRVLNELGMTFTDQISLHSCYEWINDGMKYLQGKLKRWPEHYTYNSIVGQAQRGTQVVTMPSDIYDTETNKSIIAMRVGDNKQLRYIDPREFEAQMEGVTVTQVRTQAEISDTTLALDNSYDFEDSGSVNVYISGTLYNITYTGVTRDDADGATAVLTGVPASGTGSITVQIPVDTYVWQNEQEGIPWWYTVRNGAIEFYPLVDGTEDNANIYLDYSHVATAVDTDGDTIDYQRYDLLYYWLKWKIKMVARNDSNLDYTDGDFLMFKERLNDTIRTLGQNIKYPLRPKVNRMDKRRRLTSKTLNEIPIDDQ